VTIEHRCKSERKDIAALGGVEWDVAYVGNCGVMLYRSVFST
jgi:hypothetical protein